MTELYELSKFDGGLTMTTLKASQTRIPPDTFNRVAYQGQRVRIERRGGKPVFLVNEEDLELIQKLEERRCPRRS